MKKYNPNYKWYVLALSTLSYLFITGIMRMCMPVLFSEISTDLNLSLVQLGTIWGFDPFGGVFVADQRSHCRPLRREAHHRAHMRDIRHLRCGARALHQLCRASIDHLPVRAGGGDDANDIAQGGRGMVRRTPPRTGERDTFDRTGPGLYGSDGVERHSSLAASRRLEECPLSLRPAAGNTMFCLDLYLQGAGAIHGGSRIL